MRTILRLKWLLASLLVFMIVYCEGYAQYHLHAP
ncbi:hypothetical protein A8990_101342 [Paenibacillus taihuensis]|uniref:Uncharacterized protein n=1 Tax=Paenibacillus taihuensis TaxID=1156355 RepID=A0A3D9SF66_9BACL|nr:hypothetical protein A8990_101342 [Paenibacillus taihuensis]